MHSDAMLWVTELTSASQWAAMRHSRFLCMSARHLEETEPRNRTWREENKKNLCASLPHNFLLFIGQSLLWKATSYTYRLHPSQPRTLPAGSQASPCGISSKFRSGEVSQHWQGLACGVKGHAVLGLQLRLQPTWGAQQSHRGYSGSRGK